MLGYLTPTNRTDILGSAFGDIHPVAFNMSTSDPKFTADNSIKSIMSIWGLWCGLFRQQGYLNYTREPVRGWSVASSRFDEPKTKIRPYIGDWQLATNYHAPMSTIPGISAAIVGPGQTLCTKTGAVNCPKVTNMETFARNYVFASGEAMRIVYNVAASNTTRDRPEYFYAASGLANEQFYRITYVPVLLLVGLISLVIAAVTTTAISLYTMRTSGWRQFRQVDVLRLLVDSSAGPLDHGAEVQKVSDLSDDELQKWARDYYVTYLQDYSDPVSNARLAHTGTRVET